MIKVATTTLSVMLLLGATLPSQGQPSAAQTATEEAIHRQADIIQLRRKLEDAHQAQNKKDLVTAARLYQDAFNLVQRIGVGIDAEKQETISGLATVRMQLAQEARKRSDLTEAEKQVNQVLRADPTNTAALEFKKTLDREIDARKGQVASEEVKALVPEFKAEKEKTSTLVQDARLLIEMGKLDEAEAKLNQAVKQDPEHQGAFYYLNYIKEARYAQEARKREIASKDKLLQVEKAWNVPTQRERLPQSNPFATTNLVNTSPLRQRIYQKLDRIVLNEVLYDGIPLSEVVKDLNEEARKRDPERRGINFIINSQADIPAQLQAVGGVDPVTGAPLPAAAPAEALDLNSVIIKINPPLRDVRLIDVIDAVSKVAVTPLKYSVEDYAVVFTQRGAETPQLNTRVYKVNPNTFMEGLESVGPQFLGTSSAQGGGGQGGGGGGGGGQGGQGGSFAYPRVDITGAGALGGQGGGLGGGGAIGGGAGGGQGQLGIHGITVTNLNQNINAIVRQFFASAGIDFPTNQVGGPAGFGAAGVPATGTQKALFFNDRTGVLFVRATSEELDIIEKALQVLNIAPPQVNIEARFTEITQTDNKGLGFDWFLGNTLMNNGSIGLQGGTAPSFSGASSPANPSGAFPGTPPGVDPGNPLGTTIPSSSSDGLLTSGLGNVVGRDRTTLPAVGTITGILTDPQFRVVIRAMEQRSGIDVLSAPSVTTLSGRQAKIDVTELRTIVAGQNFTQTSSGGAAGAVSALGSQPGGAVTPASNYLTQQVPLGPSLDVIPYVSADGFSIQMTLMPTIVEFLGYDDPGPFLPQAQAAAGNTLGTPLIAQLPLPKFRVRQVITSANVWDGQTIVLGGLIAEDLAKLKDKIPILGDIPLLGRLFRSESMSTSKKNLVIFVTPTIVDPAGNRVHTDDNLPYDPNAIPAQAAPSSINK